VAALIVAVVVVVGVLGGTFWLVLGADRNTEPALGTNNPYPDGVGVLGPGEDAPSYLPTPVISEREEILRDSDRRLAALRHQHSTGPPRSWMDEPGAMDAAGLVDEDS
jgi:hypothetical protein